jgi:hypothetical protein
MALPRGGQRCDPARGSSADRRHACSVANRLSTPNTLLYPLGPTGHRGTGYCGCWKNPAAYMSSVILTFVGIRSDGGLSCPDAACYRECLGCMSNAHRYVLNTGPDWLNSQMRPLIPCWECLAAGMAENDSPDARQQQAETPIRAGAQQSLHVPLPRPPFTHGCRRSDKCEALPPANRLSVKNQ